MPPIADDANNGRFGRSAAATFDQSTSGSEITNTRSTRRSACVSFAVRGRCRCTHGCAQRGDRDHEHHSNASPS
jgi:hypothetical protein